MQQAASCLPKEKLAKTARELLGNYTLSSDSDAQQVATYLYNTFLGGTSTARPLGDAINFDIERGSGGYWDVLAEALSGYSSADQKVYLSAAPQCPYPDGNLTSAIGTGLKIMSGCISTTTTTDGSADQLFSLWNQWATVNANEVFLDVPATTGAAGSGYVSPDDCPDSSDDQAVRKVWRSDALE